MFWRKKKNICEYWDCYKGIPDDDFLCAEHYQKWIDGSINKCPKCGRFKDITERLCLDCQLGRQPVPKKPPAIASSPNQDRRIGSYEAKTDGYVRPGRCYIYILEFGEGDFNIGHTADVYKEFPELREQKDSVTPGHKARLLYLELAANEEAARLREAELRGLIKTNPDQIRAMASDFHKHLRELGLE